MTVQKRVRFGSFQRRLVVKQHPSDSFATLSFLRIRLESPTTCTMGRDMELYYEKGRAHWREKAIVRGKDCKLLRQLLGETKAGRDVWRSRFEESQSELAKAQGRIMELERELKKN
jgi:hypothetical protein